MKIIYRLDTDDEAKIKYYSDKINSSQEIILPQGEIIRIYVVSDTGEVTELK